MDKRARKYLLGGLFSSSTSAKIPEASKRMLWQVSDQAERAVKQPVSQDVAGFSGDTQGAFDQTRNFVANDPTNYYGTNSSAQGLLSGLFNPGQGVGQSPEFWNDALVQAQLDDFDRSADMDRAASARERAGRGAFGDGSDLAQIEEDSRIRDQRNLMSNQLREQGLQTRMQAATQMDQLAGNARQAKISDLSLLSGIGATQDQKLQAIADAPWTRLNRLGSASSGMPTNPTSQTTSQSPLQAILGAAAMAGGAYMTGKPARDGGRMRFINGGAFRTGAEPPDGPDSPANGAVQGPAPAPSAGNRAVGAGLFALGQSLMQQPQAPRLMADGGVMDRVRTGLFPTPQQRGVAQQPGTTMGTDIIKWLAGLTAGGPAAPSNAADDLPMPNDGGARVALPSMAGPAPRYDVGADLPMPGGAARQAAAPAAAPAPMTAGEDLPMPNDGGAANPIGAFFKDWYEHGAGDAPNPLGKVLDALVQPTPGGASARVSGPIVDMATHGPTSTTAGMISPTVAPAATPGGRVSPTAPNYDAGEDLPMPGKSSAPTGPALPAGTVPWTPPVPMAKPGAATPSLLDNLAAWWNGSGAAAPAGPGQPSGDIPVPMAKPGQIPVPMAKPDPSMVDKAAGRLSRRAPRPVAKPAVGAFANGERPTASPSFDQMLADYAAKAPTSLPPTGADLVDTPQAAPSIKASQLPADKGVPNAAAPKGAFLDRWLEHPLTQMGMAMLASRSPTVAGAFGEGAMAASQSVTNRKKAELEQSRLDAAAAKSGRDEARADRRLANDEANNKAKGTYYDALLGLRQASAQAQQAQAAGNLAARNQALGLAQERLQLLRDKLAQGTAGKGSSRMSAEEFANRQRISKIVNQLYGKGSDTLLPEERKKLEDQLDQLTGGKGAPVGASVGGDPDADPAAEDDADGDDGGFLNGFSIWGGT